MSMLINKPSCLSREAFLEEFQGIYEHSPWVAQKAWSEIESADNKTFFDNCLELALVMRNIVDKSNYDSKLALLNAHPDLAGKIALAGELTKESANEQAGAGLDTCTEEELKHFHYLNSTYKVRNGFPFIMAVKGATKNVILDGFQTRINNNANEEFALAIEEVHKIALFRLQEK